MCVCVYVASWACVVCVCVPAQKECVELLESLMKGASEGEVSGGGGASSASDDDIIVVQKP